MKESHDHLHAQILDLAKEAEPPADGMTAGLKHSINAKPVVMLLVLLK